MTALFLTALLAPGCEGCRDRSDKVEVRAHLPATAEAVVELSDLSALSQMRTTLEERFAGVIPAEDIVAARTELQRALGFDPLTEAGLKEAGLPAQGSVAGALFQDGAVWVFPVRDPRRVLETAERLVEARTTAEKRTEKVRGVEVTVFGRAFGDEVAEVAAVATARGLGLLGVGSAAKARVVEALELERPASILDQASYLRLAEALGDDWQIRAILPRGGPALGEALKQAGRRIPARIDTQAAEAVESAGWSLKVTSSGLRGKGRLRLSEAARASAKAMLASAEATQPGIRAVDLPQAVLFAQVSGNASEILARLAPEGSRTRRRLRRLLLDVGLAPSSPGGGATSGRRTDAGGAEDEVLAQLTGQGALAMGLGDLAEADLKAIFGNPLSIAWTAIAIGVKDPKDFAIVTDAMASRLEERGFGPMQTVIAGHKVTSIVPKGQPDAVLVQSAALDGAVLYSNEPVVTAAILENAREGDPLDGRPGVVIEARLGQLGRQLESFDVTRLPLMFRSMVTQGIDAIGLFDRLRLALRSVEDGLAVDGALELAPPPVKKP